MHSSGGLTPERTQQPRFSLCALLLFSRVRGQERMRGRFDKDPDIFAEKSLEQPENLDQSESDKITTNCPTPRVPCFCFSFFSGHYVLLHNSRQIKEHSGGVQSQVVRRPSTNQTSNAKQTRHRDKSKPDTACVHTTVAATPGFLFTSYIFRISLSS